MTHWNENAPLVPFYNSNAGCMCVCMFFVSVYIYIYIKFICFNMKRCLIFFMSPKLTCEMAAGRWHGTNPNEEREREIV